MSNKRYRPPSAANPGANRTGKSGGFRTYGSAEASDEDPEYFMLVAIDFGTSFSGYAYSFTDKPEDIRLNDPWKGPTICTNKAPTCILVDDKDKCIAFGYDAQKTYLNKIKKGSGEKVHFFKTFKMELHIEEKWDHNLQLTAEDGHKLPALLIFAEVMRFLKEHLEGKLQKEFKDKYQQKHIKWVITVPAIWSEGSKIFMRKAASKAGLVDSDISDRLMIALEPEAASFYCRSLPTELLTSNRQGDVRNLPAGTKYMVIDCGGGTVDITLHELHANGSIKELYKANGGPWGSIYIDNSYVDLLIKVFGKQFIDRFKADNPADWLQLCLDFEGKKRSLEPGDEFTLSVTEKMARKYKMYSRKELGKSIRDLPIAGITYDDGEVNFEEEVMKENLLKNTIDSIIMHLKKLIMKPSANNVSHLFVVGGFSQSPFLQERIDEEFGTNYAICYPHDADVAVLKGAVMFGHNPNMVCARIAQKTIGIQTMHEFDPNKHDPFKMVLGGHGTQYCEDIFRKLVIKGQQIKEGDTSTFSTRPASKTQTQLKFFIYSIDKKDVNYVTDPGVNKITELSIPLPQGHFGQDMDVEVTADFSKTEMIITAKDVSCIAGQMSKLSVSYLD